MTEPAIRSANLSDLPALVRIYNHYVAETHFTFDTEPSTESERRGWMEQFSSEGPHQLLVAQLGDELAGYVSSGPFRKKPAYRSSVETTIYLAPGSTGKGLGRRLYAELLARLRDEPAVHRACAGIALPNPESIALHEKLGFSPVGTFREVGFKFERYWDVAWYELDVSGG